MERHANELYSKGRTDRNEKWKIGDGQRDKRKEGYNTKFNNVELKSRVDGKNKQE